MLCHSAGYHHGCPTTTAISEYHHFVCIYLCCIYHFVCVHLSNDYLCNMAASSINARTMTMESIPVFLELSTLPTLKYLATEWMLENRADIFLLAHMNTMF